MKFLVIGDKQTVAGFSLAGIEGIVVNSHTDAKRALNQVIKRPNVGIILITESLAKEIQQTIDELLCYRKKCHLILQIPDAQGSEPGSRSVEEFVLSALGVKV